MLSVITRCLSVARDTVCSVLAFGTQGTVAIKIWIPQRTETLSELL